NSRRLVAKTTRFCRCAVVWPGLRASRVSRRGGQRTAPFAAIGFAVGQSLIAGGGLPRLGAPPVPRSAGRDYLAPLLVRPAATRNLLLTIGTGCATCDTTPGAFELRA